MTKRMNLEAPRRAHHAMGMLSGAVIAAVCALAALPATAEFVTTPAQKATAERVAQAGVALSELAPDAPDNYTVKRGDTLWAISRIFLRSPWRWPELWGMNINEIRNPHRIYPGQQLYLDKSSGRAVLRAGAGPATGAGGVVKVSPRTRVSTLADSAIPTLAANLIEPFLAEPLIVDEAEFARAPRIVATQDRVLLARGDRAYARGQAVGELSTDKGKPQDYRVFRNATPLKDPNTGLVIGYEAQFVGNAELVRGESLRDAKDKEGKATQEIVPATIDIVGSKEEMRVGDRLIPEPPREFASYMPRAPLNKIEGARVVSVYGSAVANAAQNQIVVINRGKADSIERGHVLAILKDGATVVDRTDPAKPQIKLPNERNGLLMVFRVFDKLSYALVLDITDSVHVGDRLVNPK
jgi:LysM domain